MESRVCKYTVAVLLVFALLSLFAISGRPSPLNDPETQPISSIHLDPIFEARHVGERHLLALRPFFSIETDCSLTRKEIERPLSPIHI